MKINLYKTAVVGLLAAFAFTSCEKVVDDMNENPNKFADSPAEQMITGAQLANVVVQEGELARITGIFNGYFKGGDRQYLSYNQYSITAGDFNNIWGTLYAEGIAPSREIYAKATALNKNDLAAVALINEAQLLLTATSLWGDVPNAQATNYESFPTPTYDNQMDVYASIITKLDEAISKNPAGYAEAYVAGFDWVEVANTLKARAYLHMGDYPNAITAGQSGILDASADFKASHPFIVGGGAWNLFYHFCDWERAGYLTCTDAEAVDIMAADSAGNTRFGYYFAIPGWYSDVDPNFDYNWTEYGVFSPGEAYPLVTAIENHLIMAEASMMTSDDAGALTHLNHARQILAVQFGGFADFVAADFTNPAIGGDLHMEILKEKYRSLFGQIEGFNDLRRTNNMIGLTPLTGSEFPQRLFVPQDELNSNPNAKTVGLFEKMEVFPAAGY